MVNGISSDLAIGVLRNFKRIMIMMRSLKNENALKTMDSKVLLLDSSKYTRLYGSIQNVRSIDGTVKSPHGTHDEFPSVLLYVPC